MPIEGPIPDLGVSDLLQLLVLSRRTGRLDATRLPGATPYTLWLEEGQLSGQAGSPLDLRLGRIAVLRAEVGEADIDRALASQRGDASRPLGEILVEQGSIEPQTLRALLRFQIEEGLFRLLRWTGGRLSFQEGDPRSGEGVELRLPTDSLLLDAVRRVDEWRLATGWEGEEDPVPRLIDQPVDAPPVMDLSPLEWETLAEIDGRRTLGEIAGGLARAESGVAKALHGLVAARVVEIASGGADDAAAIPVAAGTQSTRDKGPVGRTADDEGLGVAAAALATGDIEEADRAIDAFLARHPGSLAGNVLKGASLIRLGRIEEAVQMLDRAIALDPLHESAYFHLASALVRRGDLGRARGALDTYLALAAPDDHLRTRAHTLLAGVTQTLEALDGSV